MKKIIFSIILIGILFSGFAFGAEVIMTPTNPSVYGALSMVRVPVGAKVYIDGVYIGATPITVGNVLVGPHQLTVELPGYEPYVAYVYVPASTVVNYIYPSQLIYTPISPTNYPQVIVGSPGLVKVENFMGYIAVKGSPRASQVYLDGTFRGLTNKKGELEVGVVSAGSHQVVIMKNGAILWQGVVTLYPGNKIVIYVK